MKFKIGDWVRNDNDINIVTRHIDHHHIELDNRWTVMKKECEHWKPKSNEWCWYGFELVQILGRNTKTNNNQLYAICRQNSNAYEDVDIKQLEPFTGNLPNCTRRKYDIG